MQILNYVKLEILSRSSNEGYARVAVAAFLAQLDPTVEELADIKTAVSEAVTNSIVHGYKDNLGKIYIQVQIRDNNTVEIKIKDRGCGIPDINQAMQPLYTTAGGERAGLGFAVMQSFMDNVKVSSKIGKGTIVTLKKNLYSKAIEQNRSV